MQPSPPRVTALGYTVNRIAGANRYDTAAAIATFQSTLAPVGITFVAGVPLRTAIVATGENFPDALSGGAPAFRGKHPILLTATASLPAATSGALTSLSVQRVILLGGTAAVSDAVATEIGALGTGIRVDRIAGANRGETAQLLANVLVATTANGGFNFYGAAASAACLGTGVTGPNIGIIVNGNGFADALAAGPHAGACGAPILLAGSPSTATFLTVNTAKVGVVRAIGGTAAVSAADLTAASTAATAGTPTAVLTIHEGNGVIKTVFSETIAVGAGTVKVNNTASLCGGYSTVNPAPAALAAGTCYLLTTAGVTTLWTLGPVLAEGDSVVVAGFKTPTTAGATTAATATSIVPATPVALSGSYSGAVVSATAPAVTFNRPVTLAGAASDVTIIRASAPTITENVPTRSFATAFDGQVATKVTLTIPAPALAAGDIITLKPAAVTGVAMGTDLTANLSVVVPPAGGAPVLSTAQGVLTATGGVANTTGALGTNVVVQAKAALPANAIRIVVDDTTNAGTASVSTTAAAVLDNTTGVTTVTVKLGTDAGGVINATSSNVAAAINTGASATVTATASDPTSVVVHPPIATAGLGLGMGTRKLAVTATSSKPLTAYNLANFAYDGNNDGFNDTLAGPIVETGFGPTLPDSTFVLTFDLGVGTLPTNTGAAYVAGTSKVRLAPGAITDSTSVANLAQIIAVTA